MAIGYYGGSGFVMILEDFRSGKILIHDGKPMSEGVGSAGIKGLFEPIKKPQDFSALSGVKVS